MSTHRPYQGISDAQADANAAALARRGSPYSAASEASFRVQWDWHRREPKDLHEAVRMVLRAYAEEVPTKLHEGEALADDGTPKMTARAEGYIFGSPESSDAARDAATGQPDLIGYHHTPFRATLSRMTSGNERRRKAAAIVAHVTIGSQSAIHAAISEGIPACYAYVVAEHALREFIRGMTDVKLHVPREEGAA